MVFVCIIPTKFRSIGDEKAFPTFPVHPQRAAMQREVEAFEAMHAKLWQHYPRQYIALRNGRVIDHDLGEVALLGRIDAAYPDQVVLIRQVSESLPPDLIVRSPRFAD
jgi:hypothetical protein